MVYSEGKLQSCLKVRNFQNPFNKDKSVGLEDIPCTKKGTCCRVREAKFYLYHSTKIAKAWPGFDENP